MSIENDSLKLKKLIMQDRIRRIENDISGIKTNDLPHIHERLIRLETKQKIILALLFIILGVLISK